MEDKRYHNALPENYKLHWYVIKKVLGRGGFGITYLAIDTNLNRKVAIKEFLPSELCYRDDTDSVNPLQTDNQFQYEWGLERFISEAQTLAKFEHPNIVRVIAVFEENKTGYMVMNYEEGDELQTLLSREKTLEEDFLILILFPLLDGLEKIHNAGFIHRDIKPQNIMLRSNGTPILIDFGSARQALGSKTRTLTTLVSPGYAPFEQYYSKGDKQGPWTDIYSLAATLYRCISGRAPLSAVDRSEGIVTGAGDYFVSAAELGAGRYSEQFLKAIDKGLCFKPEDRPQSIAQWRNDLKGVKRSEEDIPTVKVADKQAITDKKAVTPVEKRNYMPIYIIGIFIVLAVVFFIKTDKQFISTYLESLQQEKITTGASENKVAIDALLKNAQDSLNSLQLIAPEGKNAYFYYKEILKLDPNNEKALSGLDKIFITLFEKTKTAIDAGEYASAQKYLAKADEIKPGSEIIRLSQKVLDEKLAEQAKLEAAKKEQDRLLQEIKQKKEELLKLSNLAKMNMDEKQLISPKGNNARYRYKQILQLDTNNQEAITGLAMISKTYLSKADEAIKTNDYVLAKEYLAIVEETSPENQSIMQQKQALEIKINQYLQEKTLKNKQADTIKNLLAGAEQDLEALRLSSPAGNNALEKYKNVLALDPGNETARSGIIKIGNKYISLAKNEIDKGDFEKAYEQLITAKKIAPGLTAIDSMLHELELLKENRQKEKQLAWEQQRIEDEKRRMAEEAQRQKEEEQRKKVEALEAEVAKLEADKAQKQEILERNKIFSISINSIENKYQAMGINPNVLVNDIAALLRNYGFKVTQQQGTLSLDNGSIMEVIFHAKEDSTGKLIQWDASTSAKYLGNTVWSENEQKKGKSRELYGVQVNIEPIDDLRPARESIIKMVEKFISRYRNSWPPE